MDDWIGTLSRYERLMRNLTEKALIFPNLFVPLFPIHFQSTFSAGVKQGQTTTKSLSVLDPHNGSFDRKAGHDDIASSITTKGTRVYMCSWMTRACGPCLGRCDLLSLKPCFCAQLSARAEEKAPPKSAR